MPNPLPPYVLTRDTTCRKGCPHYGYPAVLHSHFEQKEPPSPARRDGPVMRLLIRIWGDGTG